MDSVLRGLTVYLFLLLVFRFAGRRTLSQSTNFDLVLLLIISEVVQQAMLDSDDSLTNAGLLILTLVAASIGLSLVKAHFPKIERWIEGAPIPIVENGTVRHQRMAELRIDMDDLLTAARASHGLERLDQIKYAMVEHNGEITIVPRQTT